MFGPVEFGILFSVLGVGLIAFFVLFYKFGWCGWLGLRPSSRKAQTAADSKTIFDNNSSENRESSSFPPNVVPYDPYAYGHGNPNGPVYMQTQGPVSVPPPAVISPPPPTNTAGGVVEFYSPVSPALERRPQQPVAVPAEFYAPDRKGRVEDPQNRRNDLTRMNASYA
ncbi:hypothetical protein ABW19_dt0203941 [Dactylella cylindrospora]|nr:hypothetical protein ABW19_dt0203941 [Dactylella cylindrospora]